jgi:Protein of unknown function (DUF2500).
MPAKNIISEILVEISKNRVLIIFILSLCIGLCFAIFWTLSMQKYGRPEKRKKGLFRLTKKIKEILLVDKILLVIILFAMCTLILFGYWFHWRENLAPILSSPEQHEQAEVLGKRTIKLTHDGTGDPGGPTIYFVVFKFSDDSQKEFELGQGKFGRKSYESINEGDIGMLAYKENENILYNKGQLFISFEKDPEYGGAKVEQQGLPESRLQFIIFGVLGSAIVILGVIGVVFIKKELIKKNGD